VARRTKDAEVERLVEEIMRLTGEARTEAVRRALEERLERLGVRPAAEGPRRGLLRFLEDEVWPTVPDHVRRGKLTKAEEEAILGCGEDGV
jgi:antitoxin VapB